MDDRRFDSLTMDFSALPTRRRVLGLMGGLALAGFGAMTGGIDSGADKRTRKRRRKERRRMHQQPGEQQAAQPCPTGAKRCEGGCIAQDQCCTNAECGADRVCTAQRVCECAQGTKPCSETCIAAAECCGGCGRGLACQDGKCRPSGATLYPDLRTLPPSNLSFDRLNDGTHVLRFANTVWNAGEGRLELEGDPHPRPGVAKKIFQNLYDAPAGGHLVSQRQVASDVVYHESHQHFHFADFASYLLLARDGSGRYQATTKKGTKTSFCIMDTIRVDGGYRDQYRVCGRELQGLSVGWGDEYGAELPDQWIALGAQPLADGEYGVQSIADPKGVLNEGGGGREADNAAVTYFTVRQGGIRDIRGTP
jgi:hypothetical protein